MFLIQILGSGTQSLSYLSSLSTGTERELSQVGGLRVGGGG